MQIKSNQVTYMAESAGTISSDISGYGSGIVLASTNDTVTSYLKAGIHSWNKSGSTTILDNDNAFAGSFYSQGIGGYGGVGVATNVSDNLAIDIAYDIIGLSKDGTFGNMTSLLSVAFRVGF